MKAMQNRPAYSTAPKTIDIRMYEQVAKANTRLSEKLSDVNKYVNWLENRVQECNDELMEALAFLSQMSQELGVLGRLSESTAASVTFALDKSDAVEKCMVLGERFAQLEAALQKERALFGSKVVREMPVQWVGVANEVRLMGEFDGWTKGIELSAAEMTIDDVVRTFEATLLLRPGTYRIKFVVDGGWQLAASWPYVTNDLGETDNVIEVPNDGLEVAQEGADLNKQYIL